MSNIKSRIIQVIRIVGIMAVVAAFAAAAFPTNSFAASARPDGGLNYGKAAVLVYNASNPTANAIPMPVAGAIVHVVNGEGTLVASATTDESGNARLALAEGNYKLRVSAQGFNSGGAYASIKIGQVTPVSIGLTRAIYPVTVLPTNN